MTPRIPPNSVEAEQSILGSMLVSENCVFTAMERLDSQDFYTNAHRDIFAIMRVLFDDNKPIDMVTVVEKMQAGREPSLEELSYLNELALRVPSTGNISSYIDIVKEKSMFRRLIDVCGNVADVCFKSEMTSSEAINFAGDAFYNLAAGRSDRSLVHIKTALMEGFDEIIRVAQSGGGLMGTATGFPRMDSMLSGFQPSQLIIIAGRPGMGKTSFALNIADHMAINQGKTVAIFSLEMSREQLGLRLLCSGANVSSSIIRTGDLDDKHYDKLAAAMIPIGDSPLYIDDTAAMGVTQMQAKLRQLKREKGEISMVVIDYLQLIAVDGRTENRVLQIGQITRALKIMAKDLGVPVVLLSQLSRASEKRENKQPMLSDLRDSGSIEQDADVVIFLHRDGYYDGAEENKNSAKIIIAKQRSGAVGSIDAFWNPDLTKYSETDNIHRRDEWDDDDENDENGGDDGDTKQKTEKKEYDSGLASDLGNKLTAKQSADLTRIDDFAYDQPTYDNDAPPWQSDEGKDAPAWQSDEGNDAPAWQGDEGNDAPAWQSDEGNDAPAWQSDEDKDAPAWQSDEGNDTPAWQSDEDKDTLPWHSDDEGGFPWGDEDD